MTDAGRKLVVDRQGVTIIGDGFQFSTSAVPRDALEPDLDGLVAQATGAGEVESVITGLQSMTRLTYGQYCALSRALEVIGERWSMLLVRNLLVGPRKLADLQQGLPRLPADTLLARLRELEHGGVVRRTPDEVDGEVYELTEFGLELDDITVRLGQWGARLLGEPRAEDIITPDALVMALRSNFRPEASFGREAGYQVQIAEFDLVVYAYVRDGVMSSGVGPLPGGADVVIETGMNIRPLLTGELDPDEAVRAGAIQVDGDPALLHTFVADFRMPAASPQPEN
ncbi:winged helix-turn-helix transcriptional regulator [Actinocrispum wychmicini]|uniref:HxlR family transcriptional regulator n=1 Tax=Actinocrispum wychmicini TaxID=1213861 RepID=A0A4R2J613_9PSEU|nr:winged helix-turn-helix transcriptional regulator [Actinocrispum wychmicini]TCO54393.1 HxlR family transcriptional regulator [Actinocrispum wychmicini]